MFGQEAFEKKSEEDQFSNRDFAWIKLHLRFGGIQRLSKNYEKYQTHGVFSNNNSEVCSISV